MLVTLSGIVIFFNEVQFLKAESPMLVIPSGSNTATREVHLGEL